MPYLMNQCNYLVVAHVGNVYLGLLLGRDGLEFLKRLAPLLRGKCDQITFLFFQRRQWLCNHYQHLATWRQTGNLMQAHNTIPLHYTTIGC